MLKHSLENNHNYVSFQDSHTLQNGYTCTNSKCKRNADCDAAFLLLDS